MPITGTGWELHVERLGLHVAGGKTRTYGRYQVYHAGQPVPSLAGFMCESPGPGDNTKANNGKRVEAARYPLWTQFGRYRTTGYSPDTVTAGKDPMPALRLEATGRRVGILIHPGHPPTLFLSSIGCLNPTGAIGPAEVMNYWDSRARVIAVIDDLRAFAPSAFADETMTRIPEAWVVIDGEPMNRLSAAASQPAAAFALAATAPAPVKLPAAMPISKGAALKATRWLMEHFGDRLRAAVVGKAYGVKHLCAIACQETAYKWVAWIGATPAQTIVERCVFDASGDYPGTSRSAFPGDTAAFRAQYGDIFTDMLIEEANKTRRMQNMADKPWVYKGYGLFQYDLQKVVDNRAFFEQRGWYSFQASLDRCVGELDEKLRITGGDLWKAVKAYNGSGKAAAQYAENVKVFTEWCAEITG